MLQLPILQTSCKPLGSFLEASCTLDWHMSRQDLVHADVRAAALLKLTCAIVATTPKS